MPQVNTLLPAAIYMAYKLLALVFLLCSFTAGAQKVIQLWPGAAPGSENWDWHEQVNATALPNDTLVYNVSAPSLTVFPAGAGANGTAVIICPGGSFHYLHINTEGYQLARWLNKKGVTAFILQYRLVHCLTTNPRQELLEKRKDAQKVAVQTAPVVTMAMADAREAIAYVRKHAAALGIAPNKIGIAGFSAGGALAAAAAVSYTAANRPDFAAPIYAYVPPGLADTIPAGAPPLFIAAATDDDYHLVPMSINLYSKWLAAGLSAELHIYSKGGHGFGMNVQHQPSDSWVDRFGDWLQLQGFIQ
jgi:acetyl esterase/lipase